MVLMDDTEDDMSAGASPQKGRRYPNEETGNESDAYLSIGNHANDDDIEDEDDDVEERKDDVGVSGYRKAREEGESSIDCQGSRGKLDNCASGFALVPRTAPPLTPSVALSSKTPTRKNPADWTEKSTFVLLESWGVFYLMNGRKSLRSDEWMEVAKKVNDAARNPRTDAQCRNRIDTLKKKYKKEKARMAESISSYSRWVYFKKMEQLMGVSKPLSVVPLQQRQKSRVSHGVCSGKYGFNSRHYPSRLNGLNGTSDNPLGSQFMNHDLDKDNSDGMPPQKKKSIDLPNSTSFKILIDSINNFSMVYEKIEISNRNHMLELKKMRMKFQRDLEMQRRHILERAMRQHKRLRDEESEDSDEENNDNKGIDCSGSAQNESS